jgi:hypothetical protein
MWGPEFKPQYWKKRKKKRWVDELRSERKRLDHMDLDGREGLRILFTPTKWEVTNDELNKGPNNMVWHTFLKAPQGTVRGWTFRVKMGKWWGWIVSSHIPGETPWYVWDDRDRDASQRLYWKQNLEEEPSTQYWGTVWGKVRWQE